MFFTLCTRHLLLVHFRLQHPQQLRFFFFVDDGHADFDYCLQ